MASREAVNCDGRIIALNAIRFGWILSTSFFSALYSFYHKGHEVRLCVACLSYCKDMVFSVSEIAQKLDPENQANCSHRPPLLIH